MEAFSNQHICNIILLFVEKTISYQETKESYKTIIKYYLFWKICNLDNAIVVIIISSIIGN